MRNFIRAFIALSTIILASLTITAQDAPRSVQDKFLKDATSASSKSFEQPRGFFTPFKASFAVSMAVCIGGAAADIGSSLNGQEANPLINSNGHLSVGRAVLLKGASCAWPLLIERRHPRAAFWARSITGLAWGMIAVRNLRQ